MGNACNGAVRASVKGGGLLGNVKSKLPTVGAAAQVGAGGGVTLAGITGWVGAAAVLVLDKAGSVIGSTTEPNVHAPFFEQEYRRMIELAALLALPMLLLAVIEGCVAVELGDFAAGAVGGSDGVFDDCVGGGGGGDRGDVVGFDGSVCGGGGAG